MIDISQIVSSAANAVEGARRASADPATNGFRDALSQARDSHQAAAPAPAARETVARDKPAARPAAAQADAGKPQHTAATGKKAAAGEKDQDQEDDAAATPTDAAAAAAALALMLPAAAPANPATVPAGAAGAAVAGMADPGSAAALQAALSNTVPNATAQTQVATGTTAGPADGTALAAPLQAVTAEARPAQPSVADTLATIASQRAAMQPGGSAGTEAKAGATPAVAGDLLAVRQADLPGQDTGASAGGSGHRPDSGLGQHRADPLAANPAAPDARPAAGQFAAAQAAARAGETAAATPDSIPAVAATLAGQPTPAAAAAAASRPVVAPPLYDSQWPQALGQQMIRLGTQGQQSAELQLNPPDLGPLKVVLNVVNDQAQAQFVSPHQAVRAAVEAALPHLRTALSENGIQLGHTSVGADGFTSQAGNGNGQQQQGPGHGRTQASFGGAAAAAAEPVPTASAAARPARVLGRGEIDTFA
ncbi:FliK: Flagellar Biosynthesis protein; hook-length control protein [Cupriavidus taiwanensis]|uniref:FliK: Flagellar Biosynthesis protein hook-length control protein n=1 Tax=Cupriavidus taiwanensis TaxID=164546 RepID=A0A375E5T5_9BURK|nr:flagellar hook-length control protein FliK [Cupriavidus taiwanensis]SOZ61883.1 FliK: Flagellar Biosynthesis protein; hook-length control protein [Cupriavidus taiwanensis]SOZ62129.1 FliK: Flagellar Biosynthesis protein; hook-length control protein [Cupriavidus taiwanensis]SOZ66159.1 FliK: Flagellar Biosynthesis protein; hook-length control protein [Cupriavidus taiwanensis]SPA07446.1 FliK: Flagellar Biosynthesis protein; hook-length control protein [Cupriavidus taiwanensis]